MRQWNRVWAVVLPSTHGFGQILPRVRQMPALRKLANDQRQLDMLETLQQLFAPRIRAFRSWWQISGLSGTRIAKSHRQNCDFGRVVERFS